MAYSEDEMLMLSGIQHFVFCPRQWALIHIEGLWEENYLTFEGQLQHSHADDPFYRQVAKGMHLLRSVSIASKELGLSGIIDIMELHPSDSRQGIEIQNIKGRWMPYPIEYKHGKPKSDNSDALQVAAQAMCLEEMYGIVVDHGAVFYHQTRHRQIISVTEELRNEVRDASDRMHFLFDSSTIPAPMQSPKCKKCSLINLCLPELGRLPDPTTYNRLNLYEESS